ncbi:putative phytosulfokines 6 [Tripterygium wilfordii]|uniref:putative phytosulfokines 6 n=1 Tax=Tripterygium wilfordii TaxID=458696 RepID=UPI0018F7ED7E|nr:putative phytosulfokines 6 [Tripterygium wilfordii]
MKQSFQYNVLLLFLLFLVSNTKISARLMATKQGQGEVINHSQTITADSTQMESSESMHQLMRLDVCDNEDEECTNRRMMAEAHLDYIYTQHHKP